MDEIRADMEDSLAINPAIRVRDWTHWRDRWNNAWEEREGENVMPLMQVTQEEYEFIREYGAPWEELPDGTEMWAGVVVEVLV